MKRKNQKRKHKKVNAGIVKIKEENSTEIILFECIQPTKLRLTKCACANMYSQANIANKNWVSALNAFHYCYKCVEGEKNHKQYHIKGKEEIKPAQKKQCELYLIDPTQCKNEKIDGWFFRNRTQKDQNWGIKKYCCSECGVHYNYLKAQGKIK